jgi:hypothetical protein
MSTNHQPATAALETRRGITINHDHRWDRDRAQATNHSVPCTCGADVDIDAWDAHRGL